ncbi:MAG: HAD family hydrolase [Armatimonadota bacterium]
MIRAVLFDIDDTLCDDTGHFTRAAERVAGFAEASLPGLTSGALAETYLEVSDHYWTREIALTKPEPLGVVRERLWRRAFARLDLEPPQPILSSILAEYARLRLEVLPELHPGALEVLGELRSRGLRVGLVTNGLSETHVPKATRLGLLAHADTFLMPDRTGWAKPHPRVFELACADLGVPLSATLHVGDSLSADVGGAKAAGCGAVWFNPQRKAHPGKDHPLPDHVIEDLRAIPDLATRWTSAG